MPIDPGIPLQSQGVGQLINPMQIQQQIQQAQIQRQQAAALEEQRRSLAEQRAQQTAKITQENADRAAMGQAYQAGGGVRDTTIKWATQNAPNIVPSLTEYFDKADERTNTILKARHDLVNQESDLFGTLADGALKHGATTDAVKTALDYVTEKFPEYQPHAAQIWQAAQQTDDAGRKTLLEQIRDQAPAFRVKPAAPPETAAPGVGVRQADGTYKVVVPKEAEHSAAYKEWQDAVSTGYGGSFTQYQNEDANRKRPITNINTGVSGGGTFTSPEQAKASLTPPQMAIVQRLIDYKQTLPAGVAITKGDWPKLLEAASVIDPTFDQTQYNARLRGRTAFTSGKEAQNIRGLNTAVGHINSLTAAAKSLDNSDWSDSNKVMNALATHLPITAGLKARQGAITDARTKFNAVTGELASIFKQSGATDQEIASWKGTIGDGDPAQATPNQWKAFVNGALELMGSRMQALSGQYENVMGKPKDFTFLTPQSRTILRKLGVDVTALDPIASGTTGPAASSSGGGVEQWVRDPTTGKLVKKGG